MVLILDSERVEQMAYVLVVHLAGWSAVSLVGEKGAERVARRELS